VIEDASRVPDGTTVTTDVCVIGGGAAGIAMALALTRTGRDVVVLESGGEDPQPEPATQALAEGESVGLPYFALEESRLRCLGGSTNHWGGLCRPFDEHDFAAKPGIPLSGWPIGLPDVAPYYDRAAEIVGITDDTWGTEAWAARDAFAPLPLGGEDGVFVTRVVQVISSGERSMGARYRDTLASSRAVTLYLHANAESIELDEAGTTVTGVAVALLSGGRFTVAARQVVLAAGGLENPRLLLASTSRFPQGVGNQHDVVGRYFLEHPRFVAGALVTTSDHPPIRFYETHNVGDDRIAAYLAPADAVQAREGLCDVQIRLAAAYGKEFAASLDSAAAQELRDLVGDVKHADVGALGPHVAAVATDLLTFRRYLVGGGPVPVPHPDVVAEWLRSSVVEREALLPGLLGDVATVSFHEATGRGPVTHVDVVTRIDPVPNRDSRVTLSDERDALGMQRIRLDWRLSDQDRHSVARTMELLAAQVGQAGLGRIRITFDEEQQEWPADLAGGWHHMGTTRMSDDPRLGVVDRQCRVHGTTNLFVAGSSVFPTSGSGTPTMLIVALALRLADHMRSTV
jgi:choline dehydrogenase-like flavoprotein